MKHYVKPEAEVLVVLVEDIIRTSTAPEPETGDNLYGVSNDWRSV